MVGGLRLDLPMGLGREGGTGQGNSLGAHVD